MEDNPFILTKTKKVIIDERGDETFYDYYYIKLNKNLKMLLKKISIKLEYKNKIKNYEFSAIPDFNSCQGYYIKPIKINNNLEFIDEMKILKNFSESKEKINNYYFYNNENEMDIDTLLSSLGYQYYKNNLVLGTFVSDSGITSFKPLINKKLIIPSKFKDVLDEIELNSWRINILLTLSDTFKNENGVNYKGNLGIRSFLFNNFINKLLDMHLLYIKNGWIYDVYRLLNFDDDANRYFIYEGLKLSDINYEAIKQLLNKIKIDIEKRKEEFEVFYSDILNWFISRRYKEIMENEVEMKPILLKYLGLDYK